jgi:catechol 2,3-dioxygenase
VTDGSPLARCVGHINLHVSDWRASLAFYRDGCGLREVRRNDEAGAVFLTSGFNHHEVEFFQRPRAAFNHLGVEMVSEMGLVSVWNRLRSGGIAIERSIDSHGMARSIFLRDPDGQGLHLIANLKSDWETYWKSAPPMDSDPWDPATGPYSSQSYFAHPMAIPPSHTAQCQATRLGGATLNVENLGETVRFYRDLIGFRVIRTRPGEAILTGVDADCELTIVSRDDVPRGLACFTLNTCDERIECERPLRLVDPDGFVVVFRRERP